ncbi:MAG: dephospho-CoA kinase [Cocleimonas sp.]|nr:dephospho-CoA kinase [Cocleimonas sp.]
MIKIGLTGGIGSGKSTVTDVFFLKHIPIIDADKIARDLVKPKTDALKEIVETFGKIVLQEEGGLNREALKKQVFSDAKKLKQLELILHPKIYHIIKEKLLTSGGKNTEVAYVIADIPLLIEKGYIDLFDQLVVVDCLPEQQIQRVLQRDTMDIKMIETIMEKQVSREERLKYATYVLDNSGTKQALLLQIESLHKRLSSST